VETKGIINASSWSAWLNVVYAFSCYVQSAHANTIERKIAKEVNKERQALPWRTWLKELETNFFCRQGYFKENVSRVAGALAGISYLCF
jgi:predicted PP-loop superfamily ATPase